MKTKSGVLEFGKREEEAMRCVLFHVMQDMSYGGGGTFSSQEMDENGDYKVDTKEMAKAKRGIECFNWILEFYK